MRDQRKKGLFIEMIILCVLCDLMNATPIAAQVLNDNIYRNRDNRLYWQNKKPFPGYWQQDVSYKIKASIDEEKHTVAATESLTYWNNSPDTLNFVYFHLYQNAFVKGSYFEALHQANDKPIKNLGFYGKQGLGTSIHDFRIQGEKVKTEIDNTIMKVYLKESLMPGESVVFDINFITYFDNSDFRRRMKMYPSYGFMHYNGVHWYPRISVYDIKKGWDTDQHLNKELYGDFGLFDVELTFANNYVVEASGQLQNENEVYPGDLRKRLDVKNFANKTWNEPPSIITAYDKTQRKTWHYIANNVHDFAFTADPHYRIAEADYNGIKCIGLVNEAHAAKWQNSADLLAKTIKIFSEDFGQYEYPKIVAADANDGMEYPMLTLVGGGEPDYHGVIVHEVGHNWFYGMIGNNETYRAALDEGFTQFLTIWGLEKLDGVYGFGQRTYSKKAFLSNPPEMTRDRSLYLRYLNDAIKGIDKPLNTHSNDFHGALHHENGYSNVYHKTGTMLYNLQYLLGDELFLNAMKHYVAKWKIAHPYFEDFRQSMIEYTHQDLNWFFDQWLETTKRIDYGIQSIKKTRIQDQYKITFKRHGEMQMPLDVRITAHNDQQYNYIIPNSTFVKKTNSNVLPKWYGWDILFPTYSTKLMIPSGIKVVEIDPSYRLADIDMMDNYKSPQTMLAKESHHLRLENYISKPHSWKKYDDVWRPDLWWNSVDGIKTGLHIEGSYMNYLRKLYCTVWFNTRLLSNLKYRAYEGTGWWSNASPIDYTLRYETPLLQINNKISWGFESRFMDAFAKHSLYSTYQLNSNQLFKVELTTLYRNSNATKAYLFYPDEWSSFSSGDFNTKKNSYLQVQFKHHYSHSVGFGDLKLTVRSPLNYNYSYFQSEIVHKTSWKKFDLSARGFLRMGVGDEIPYESALFLQGANPEEMMENKFTRSQGILPPSLGGFSTNEFSNLHTSGGLNLRGYTGYYAIDEKDGITYINYKGRSGAALNTEIEFDRYFKFKPKFMRDYIHVDAYLFGDAGSISRGILNQNKISELTPVRQWSKLRMDAGLGILVSVKKFGRFDKINPLRVRFDFPVFISSTPFYQPKQFDFRWLIGLNRSF